MVDVVAFFGVTSMVFDSGDTGDGGGEVSPVGGLVLVTSGDGS
jgi:hypothetical protein